MPPVAIESNVCSNDSEMNTDDAEQSLIGQNFVEIKDEDLPYEEDLRLNPYSVKHWLRYIDHKRSGLKESKISSNTDVTEEHIYIVYERAVLQMPMSYKLWHQYVKLRVDGVKDLCVTSSEVEVVNNVFERCLVFMHRMPRIWLIYLEFLVRQKRITRTRKTFDRALCALPITQHERVWKLYLKFVMMHDIPETAVRVWRRYLKLCSEDTEDYINYLRSIERLEEAAKKYEWCCNTDSFVSKYGKSKYQLWSELCDLISNNPKETSLHNAEAIIRHGLQRYIDQAGRLWNCLSQFYINSGLFERARDVFEEGIQSVNTVRDFTQVFDAYTQFEELLLNKGIENSSSENQEELEFRLARMEDLISRRALLLNSVMLRQNPHNVLEWQKRVDLYKEMKMTKMIVTTYMEAVKTVDPKRAAGKLWELWVSFAKFYEENKQLKDARAILGKATEVHYIKVDDLASVWCEWAEMEIRNDDEKEALQILKRATASPGVQVSYFDEGESVQRRLHKSLKLWSLYADLEESLGTFKSCKAVYDRIIDLRIATPQIIINFGMFLIENNYFEEAFKAYEKGIALFKWPYVYDIWNTYLLKFLDRYKGSKIERARDLFEQCLERIPAKYCKSLYLLYAQMEEKYGLARHALQVYSRATKAVPPDEKLELYNVYLKHASQMCGIMKTREIYQEAIEELADKDSREMCVRFAETERVLGEIDRARQIYIYCSQICDPRMTKDFWDKWTEFEVKHGNEDTMKELLRIKRSMQAKYNTQVNQMSAQMLQSVLSTNETSSETPAGDSMKMLDNNAQQTEATGTTANLQGDGNKIMFVRGNATDRDVEVAENARVTNPDEIDIDDDEEEEDQSDEEELPQQKEIPKEVYSGLR